MVQRFSIVVAGMVALLASACASTNYVSTWKSPTAKPLQLKGAKVAAAVLIANETARKAAEDQLAKEITARGADGVPMYQVMPNVDPSDEAQVKAELEKNDVQGVVVMRPTQDKGGKAVDYSIAQYSEYWGPGFYSANNAEGNWLNPDGMPYDVTVSVDTLIYSLKQNQLVWAGKSKSINPPSLDTLVKDLADDTAEELSKVSLIGGGK